MEKNISNDSEYEEIRKKVPDFVNYVENGYKHNLNIIYASWIFSLILFVLIWVSAKSSLQILAILYSLIGSFFWAIGTIKTPKYIIPLSMARIGYSKPLANEYLKTSKEVSIGIWLIVLSIFMQAIVFAI